MNNGTGLLQDVSSLNTKRVATVAAIERYEANIERLRKDETEALIQEALGRGSIDKVRGVQQQIAEEERQIAEAHNQVEIIDGWLAEKNRAVKQATIDQLVAKYQIDAKVQASALATVQRWLKEAPDVIEAYAQTTHNCDLNQSHIADLAAELGIEPPDLTQIDRLVGYAEVCNTFEREILLPLRRI